MMKRQTRGFVMGFLIAMFITASFSCMLPVKLVAAAPTTYYVGSGSGNFSTSIQPAINAASSGDKIFVYNGTYNEILNIGKSLNITGQDWRGTIVDAGNSGYAVQMWAAGIRLYNLKITRAGNDGIVIFNNADNCRVDRCLITGSASWGVDIQSNSDNCVINGNIVEGNTYGVIVMGAIVNNVICNNRINNSITGVYVFNGGKYNTVNSNVITNMTGNGIDIRSSSIYNVIHGNILASNAQHAYCDNTNFWNLSYPAGGNFYDTYPGTDMLNGPAQNVTGNDGIGDTARSIPGGGGCSDAYPILPCWNAIQFYKPYPEQREVCAYALGTVQVAVIFPESNGVIDVQYENWTAGSRNTVISEIIEALNWWDAYNTSVSLSFSLLNVGSKPTSYEPIRRPSTDEGLWIGEIMSGMGYSSGSYTDRVKAYNHWLRTTYGTDWAFTIFVADSENPSEDGYFTDSKIAWCQLDQGLVVQNYKNNGWGISNMNKVVAHETGHVFFATDEYMTPGERGGYLNELEVDSSGCLMDTNTLALSAGTKKQIGWRDSDTDGVVDILDVDPNTRLESFAPDPTMDETPYYTGTAVVVAYTNANPYSSGRAVTTNRISSVQYRVDNITWLSAQPLDGSFNGPVERFYFRPAALSVGSHFIEVRAVSTSGNSDATPAADIVNIIPGTETIYVDDGFADEPFAHKWNTVTEGVADSNAGDTVYVYNGSYTENVIISNRLNLTGQHRSGVFLNASAGSYGFRIDASGCRINNITVKLSASDGILVTGNYNRIIFCNFTSNAQYGISVATGAKYNRIYFNNFLNNKPGGKQANDADGNSFWNATSLGNHWSDKTGPDIVAPFGIVDTPYSLDGFNNPVDFYPLVYPISYGGSIVFEFPHAPAFAIAVALALVALYRRTGKKQLEKS
jgi:nitrous oxidase accessory protein NosD